MRVCLDCKKNKPLDEFKKRKVRYRSHTCNRCAMLRRMYGINDADYDTLFEAQGGKCAICGSADSGRKGQPLFVDHDHSTGKVRGLLCWPCNRGLGFLGDDAEGVRKALVYLETS